MMMVLLILLWLLPIVVINDFVGLRIHRVIKLLHVGFLNAQLWLRFLT